MRVPLSAELLDEVARFRLRSSCVHCLFYLKNGECLHEWPNRDQRRWPLDAPDESGEPATEMAICKEFELR